MEPLKTNRKDLKHLVLEVEQRTKRLLPNSFVCLVVVIIVTLTVLLLMAIRRDKPSKSNFSISKPENALTKPVLRRNSSMVTRRFCVNCCNTPPCWMKHADLCARCMKRKTAFRSTKLPFTK